MDSVIQPLNNQGKIDVKENQDTFHNFKRTKFAVKIRIWRVNWLDKQEVKAQAEKTKKSTSWSRETVRARSEILMFTSILLLNELHVLQIFSTPKLNQKEANH